MGKYESRGKVFTYAFPELRTDFSVASPLYNSLQCSAQQYQRAIQYHPHLILEYSLLCNQLRTQLSKPEELNPLYFQEQLTNALALCELLEYIHLHYLNVPREVRRFRREKAIFKTLLRELGIYTLSDDATIEITETFKVNSQKIRNTTLFLNAYRILLTRSRRFLILLDGLGSGSELFHRFVINMDSFTNPFFNHLGWSFHLPRLLTNLFLIAKHTLPGGWLSEEERTLDWSTRLYVQLQRRWFELGNDLIWTVIGFINCFLFLGPLAPLTAYVNMVGLVFDVINAALRAYVELRRLDDLEKYYLELLATEGEESRPKIQPYLDSIKERKNFDRARFAIQVSGTVIILLVMIFALPIFTFHPVVTFVGAVLLLALWFANQALTQKIEPLRPKDTVDESFAGSVRSLSFFAEKKGDGRFEAEAFPEIVMTIT